jgi:hypothetical protein
MRHTSIFANSNSIVMLQPFRCTSCVRAPDAPSKRSWVRGGDRSSSSSWTPVLRQLRADQPSVHRNSRAWPCCMATSFAHRPTNVGRISCCLRSKSGCVRSKSRCLQSSLVACNASRASEPTRTITEPGYPHAIIGRIAVNHDQHGTRSRASCYALVAPARGQELCHQADIATVVVATAIKARGI